MKPQKWIITFFVVIIAGLAGIAVLNVVIDPFFHFHKPIKGLQYPLKEERYINDGIQRYFDYEAMITGTSEAQNFNSSELEKLLDKKTVKTCYSGASFHELSQSIQRAICYNPQLDTVICSFDPNNINTPAEQDNYTDYPEYLYDSNLFNDVKYIYNKDVINKSIAVINYTRSGQKTPDFDEYSRFDIYAPHGKEAVINGLNTSDTTQYGLVLSEDQKKVIEENVTKNFIELADANPDVKFIFFVPPYSYAYWEALERTDQLNYAADSIEYAVGLMVEHDNIEIYDFSDHREIVCELDYYSDSIHYNGTVCDMICNYIASGEGKLTEDNYKEHYDNIIQLYEEMDYSDIREPY